MTDHTHLTLKEYIQRIRIKGGQKLQQEDRLTINEMYESGYNDARAFRYLFSLLAGVSPYHTGENLSETGQLRCL